MRSMRVAGRFWAIAMALALALPPLARADFETGMSYLRSGKYLEAAGERGIPCTMVVDQSGRIAWIGHPRGGLDQVLDALIAGTYDIDLAGKVRTFKKARDKARSERNWEEFVRLREQLKAIQKELGEDDDQAVVEKYREKIEIAGLPEEAKNRPPRTMKY